MDDTLKHGLLDIIREFRYRLLKHFTKLFQALQVQNRELVSEDFDVELLFDEAFKKSFVTKNYEILALRLTELFAKSSIKKLPLLEGEVGATIQEELSDLNTLVEQKALTLSDELVENFFTYLQEPMKALELKFEKEKMLIKEHIEKAKEESQMRETLAQEINKKIKAIELIVSRCS